MPGELPLPIDCEPGQSCWVVRSSTMIPAPAPRITRAGRLTGARPHKGTDFALRDLSVMAQGVEVRAAAAGVVDALRDGVPDISVEDGGAAIAARNAGMRICNPLLATAGRLGTATYVRQAWHPVAQATG